MTGNSGLDTFLQGAEDDLDADVAGRIVGPLGGVGHRRPDIGFDDGGDVGAGVGDELHAGCF